MTVEKVYEMVQDEKFKTQEELRAFMEENNVDLNEFVSYALKQPRELDDDELDFITGGTGEVITPQDFQVQMQDNSLVWVDRYVTEGDHMQSTRYHVQLDLKVLKIHLNFYDIFEEIG